jgi:hypothetical protein
MKLRALGLFCVFGCAPCAALAHHGIAGVGAAALEGPGAPVESGSSAVLPEDKTLIYAKLDDAKFKTYDSTIQPERNYSQFWMLGIGHGFTPWFSAYLFAPYNIKTDTSDGFDSRGWADISWIGQIGFRYDSGFRLNTANESLDDMEDWHFTAFGGGTLPTGNANHRLADGSIDPNMSLGFGRPSWSLGFTATKQISRDLTFNAELLSIRFQKYVYSDGNAMKFGTESHLNGSLVRRLYTDADTRLRVDGVLEAQYLTITRDSVNDTPATASGGRMAYLLPGLRFYQSTTSFAIGIKKAVWTQLRESNLQQGSEGKEKYRLIVSASLLF